MANFILGNTTGEICCEIQQSYMRLTGNYVGPLCTSNVSTSGFLIRDANDNSGIYVANCAIQTCKNKIEYTDVNSANPAYLALPANKCFYITGNNSVFSFSNVGNFAAGSGVYSAFNGIQSFSSSPSFTLIPNTATINNSFRSLNCSCQVQFYICQSSNSGVCLSGSNAFRFDNLDKQGVYYISGNSTSISGLPLSSYSFANYGNSYFNATSLFSGNLNITGTGCFNAAGTGLDVNTKSIFRKDSVFSGNVILTGGYTICSDGLACFKSGAFPNLSGIGDLNFNNAYLNTVTARSITGTGNSCFQCLKVSGLCVTTGCFNNINGSSSDILICNYVNLCLSGNNLYNYGSFQNSGFFCNIGNFLNTGSGAFYNICTTGLDTSLNVLSGCLCVQKHICAADICGFGMISGGNFCSTGNFLTTGSISGTLVSGAVFSQTSGSTITCFASSGFHIGTACTGYIKAANTAKAWGVFSLNNGVPTLLTGYNVCRVTLPITGIAASGTSATLRYYPTGNGFTGQWNSPYVIYGLALNETVKAPFTFNLQFHPVGCFDLFSNVRTGYLSAAGATLNDMSGYLRSTGAPSGVGAAVVSGFGFYSGSSGTIPTLTSGIVTTGWQGTGLVNSWGPLGSYMCSQQIPMHSTLVNCAGKNTSSIGNYTTGSFEKITFGNNYGEVIFSLLPACNTLSSHTYYCIGNNSLNGTGTFIIFGY
jgi:hypothetical protein